MTYLKITNSLENHNGLQYSTGLIEDILPFRKEGSCCAGGIYFSDEKNICEFVSYGIWIREVTIPSDSEMVQDPEGGKWRASKIILGERKSLLLVSTWEWLVSIGVDIHSDNESALRNYCRDGYLDVVKYLVSLGADVHADDEYSLRWAIYNGHLEIVKYLVSVGANIHHRNNDTIAWASYYSNSKIVKFLESCK